MSFHDKSLLAGRKAGFFRDTLPGMETKPLFSPQDVGPTSTFIACGSAAEAEMEIARWETSQEYGPERSLTVTYIDEKGESVTLIATAKPGQPNASFNG